MIFYFWGFLIDLSFAVLVGQGYSDTVKWLGNPFGKMILNRDVFDEWFNSNELIKDPAWNDKFLAGFPKNNHVFFILDTFQEAFQEVAGVLLLLLGCGNRKSGETRSSRKFRVMKNGVSDGWTLSNLEISANKTAWDFCLCRVKKVKRKDN